MIGKCLKFLNTMFGSVSFSSQYGISAKIKWFTFFKKIKWNNTRVVIFRSKELINNTV